MVFVESQFLVLSYLDIRFTMRADLKLIFHSLRGFRNHRADTARRGASAASSLLGNIADNRSSLGSEITSLDSKFAQSTIRGSHSSGDLALHTFKISLLFSVKRCADGCRDSSCLLCSSRREG